MTFIEFKKLLLDAEISLPKFSKLIKVSEKNIQSYKKKGEVPNTIAVIAKSFVIMHHNHIDYRHNIEELGLEAKTKKGAGFSKKESVNSQNLISHSTVVKVATISNKIEGYQPVKDKAILKQIKEYLSKEK